ncbi:phosphoglycerate mutase family protein [Methylomonas sp. HW2-6]|uniref:phosphoglycerate mutase family protein n=1 Tax=Methylomonas sp. HW2-6 TaxID=3376687 RepID=UPI004042518F
MTAPPPARIVLLRHGRPSVALTGILRATDLARLADAYRVAGIVDAPPPATRAVLKDIGMALCSDLPRSRQSAQALGFGENPVADALFGEAQLPHFHHGRIRLPAAVWLPVLRLLWLAGFSRNGESYAAAKRRARSAAQRLIDYAHIHGSVALVGHGVMNHLIGRELRAQGWCCSLRPGKDYWAYAVYEAN